VDTLPRPVKNLMEVLSAELFARRLAGQALSNGRRAEPDRLPFGSANK
jgi:hypothetical protein